MGRCRGLRVVKALARCFQQINPTSHVPLNSTLGALPSQNVVVRLRSTASQESWPRPARQMSGAAGTTSRESTYRIPATHTGLEAFIAGTKSALDTLTSDMRVRWFLDKTSDPLGFHFQYRNFLGRAMANLPP